MKKSTFLIIVILTISTFVNAQKTDTIPNCYCDCIDTNEIIGDKAVFYQNFEKNIIKSDLKTLQSLDEEAYRTFFTNLYKQSYLIEKRRLKSGKYVIYPSSPICGLLQKHLRIRLNIDKQMRFYEQIGDSLGLNKNIENLKYRIWVYPTFQLPKLLEIYTNSDNLEDNKAISYRFEKFIFRGMKSFENEITERKIIEVEKEKWMNFIEKTETYNISSLPQQNDQLGFRLTVKDGFRIVVEVYENDELVHLLYYSNPMFEGSERHNETFRAFYRLVNETFD